MNFDYDTFVSRLKTAVVNAGGNNVVSAKSGIKYGSISLYITGKSAPTIEKVSQLAAACNVSLDWLAYGKEEPAIDLVINDETKAVITQAQKLAEQMAKNDALENNYDPKSFGEAFGALLEYQIRGGVTEFGMDELIKFQKVGIAEKQP